MACCNASSRVVLDDNRERRPKDSGPAKVAGLPPLPPLPLEEYRRNGAGAIDELDRLAEPEPGVK